MPLLSNLSLRHLRTDEVGRTTDMHRIEVTWSNGDRRSTALKLSPGEALLACAEMLAGRRSDVEPWGEDLAKVGRHVERICRATAPRDDLATIAEHAMMRLPHAPIWVGHRENILDPVEAEVELVRGRVEELRQILVDLLELESLQGEIANQPRAHALKASPLWILLGEALEAHHATAARWATELGVLQAAPAGAGAAGRMVITCTLDLPAHPADEAWVERIVDAWLSNPRRHAEQCARVALRTRLLRERKGPGVAETLRVLGFWDGEGSPPTVTLAPVEPASC